MRFARKLFISALLAGLFGGAAVHAAEFEVMDRFSVDGYSVFRGSAAVPGGGFTVGGSTFVVKGGNVGIGTAEPGTKLDISAGSAGATQPLTLQLVNEGTGLGTGNAIQFNTLPGGTNKAAQIRSYITNTGVGDLMFDTASSNVFGNVMTLKGSGNVGIGTASPFSVLEVLKTAGGAASPATSGTADPTVVSRFHYGTVGLDIGILEGGAGFIQNRDVSSLAANFPLLLNPNGGNVGIGTTAPGQKLEVNGKLKVGDDGLTPSAGTIRWSGVHFEGYDGTKWRTLDNKPGRRYIRITLKNGTSGASVISLAELQLYDGDTGLWLVNNMTSGSTPSPKAVTWTATVYSTSYGWKALDGNGPTSAYSDGYMSSSPNSTVTLDLGAGNTVRVTKYRIWTSNYSDGGGTYRPNSWTLEESDDGATWTTLDSRSDSPVPSNSYLEFGTSS